MTSKERSLGWTLLLTSAVSFALALVADSYDSTKTFFAFFAITSAALNILLSYDLFKRSRLDVKHRTYLCAGIWIIPFVNVLLFNTQ